MKLKSYRKELYFNIPSRRGLVNITPQVQQAIRDSGIKEGLVLINAIDVYKRQSQYRSRAAGTYRL